MNQKLVLRGLAAAWAVAILVVLPLIPAGADEPFQQGWWSATNTGTAPAQAPPDVPSDGLLVQGGAHGPSAFAAVIYPVSDGATVGKLTLTVSRPSATTPSAALEVCPLASTSIVPDQGGPMSEAPTYDCKTKVTAGPDKSGSTYSFQVAGLVAQGALAVAIVPPSPTTRVVFSKPGASSLTVSAPPAASSSADDFSSPAPADTSQLAPAPAGGGGGGLSGQPAVASAPSVPAQTQTQPTPQVAPSPTSSAPASTGEFAAASTKNNPTNAPATLGVLAGLALTAGLWAYAGRDKTHSTPAET